MTERVLDVSGVDSGYGEVQVLRNLVLRLESDKTICIIGPDGAGKPAALKTVFDLLESWTGSVELNGRDITDEEPGDLARVGMDYVPQVDDVFSSFIIDEGLRMGGVTRLEGLRTRIDELYDRFSVPDEKHPAKARTLSGGQRRVLTFARALVMGPEVLLIGKPSVGFAPNIVQSVFEDVKKVNELGTTVLMVEQSAREGLGISDRGYVLDQGTVAYEDDADSLLDDLEVSRFYVGGADYESVEDE